MTARMRLRNFVFIANIQAKAQGLSVVYCADCSWLKLIIAYLPDIFIANDSSKAVTISSVTAKRDGVIKKAM
jgi:hypothetical protein